MTIGDLYAAVTGAINAGNMSLLLPSLGSSDCTALAAGYLPSNTLSLTNAVCGPLGADTFTVTGTGVDQPITGFPVSVLFYVSGNNAEFTLTANAPANWQFNTGFPSYSNTLLAGNAFSASPNVQIVLQTLPASVESPAGMMFSGTMNLAAMTSGLSALMGVSTLPVSGPVVIENNGTLITSMALSASQVSSLNLFILTIENVSFDISVSNIFISSTAPVVPAVSLTISGIYAFESISGSYEIPLSAVITSLTSNIRFSAMITGLIQAALNDLSTLIAGQNLDSYLPQGYQLDSILQLTSLMVDYNPSATNSVSNISLSIANRSPWTVLQIDDSGKSLTADQLVFTFSLLNPFSNPAPRLSFAGEISIGDLGTMCVQAMGPNWLVQGYLKEGSVVMLTDIVNLFLGAPSGAPEMQISELSFSLSPDVYSLGLSMKFYWWPNTLPLYLNSVSFDLASYSGATTAYIAGDMYLGIADMLLEASYPGRDGAWILSGSTAPGTSIKATDLMTVVASIFKTDTQLPAMLSTFVISDLGATFNTLTSDFTFHCTGNFVISDIPVAITVDIKIIQQSDLSYRKTFGGKMVLAGNEFVLIFDTDTTKTWFVAEYYNLDGGQVLVRDLISQVTSNSTLLGLIPADLSITLKDALFAWNSNGSSSDFLFAMDWGMGVSLSNLPLVGQYFRPDETLDLAFQVLFASDAGFTTTVLADLNTLIPPNTIKLPAQAIASGLSLITQVRLGGVTSNITLPVAINQSGQLATTGNGTWGNNPQPQWYNVQKTFGPVYFNRFGVLYNTNDSQLYFYLDASLTSGGLNITMDGLSLSAPITEFWDVSFGLNGMGIEYSNGALDIGGAFLRSTITDSHGVTYDQYSGTAIIRFESFGLAALGAYAQYQDAPSMFIYGQLGLPIGGPPFFFVTGLSAGFGYNRSLVVPTLDNMLNFPLVATALELSGGGAGSNLTSMLSSLSNWIPPQTGEYWLAAGITFTSFNIVDSFALLTVAFGQKFQINVFGLATVVAPPDAGQAAALAELQLAIIATFDWDSGYLGVTGQLTNNSFLFSRDAKLTGGFAVCTWFQGEHAGDFVVTVGGYHPKFNVPAWYPRVPRLGLNWQVDASLLVKGELYFALTPGAIMAGGLLQATWTSGAFKAWFSAHADFMVAWKPYYYSASIGVTIGASYTFTVFGYQKTITADVGASLSIWGPDFSGIATVDLWIISFDVEFGASQNVQPQAISYSEFSSSFLPENPVSINTMSGITGTASDGNPIINPATFALGVDSVIPIQSIVSSQQQLAGNSSNQPGIAPMDVQPSSLSLTLTVTISSPQNETLTQLFTFTPATKNYPAGLWGTALQPVVNSPAFINGLISGFVLSPVAPTLPPSSLSVAETEFTLETTVAPDQFSFSAAESETFTTGDANRTTINDSITDPAVTTERNQLLAAMNITAPVNLTNSIGDMFIVAPVIIED